MNAWIPRLRLATGLMMFTFVASHLLNHAAGVFSLAAMESSRLVFLAVWRNPVVGPLLLAALLTHFAIAMRALFLRKRLRDMSRPEAVQLAAGLAIIPALVEHVVGTSVAFHLHGSNDYYAVMLWFFAVFKPEAGLWQTGVLITAWTHGCLGVWMWLRLKPFYAAWRNRLFAAALLLPAVSIAGFVAGMREVLHLSRDAAWRDAMLASANFPDSTATLEAIQVWIWGLFFGVLVAVLFARWIRGQLARRHAMVTIAYPAGRAVMVPVGTTILEASLLADIPHAHVCGGRGRCSTCRVRVGIGAETLPAANDQEERVLRRAGAAPNVRLACQLRPIADVAVAPLLPPQATPRDAWARPGHLEGQERELVILFADLRGFTAMSEKRLPYDVVFILNRYFAAMGRAIEDAGGHLDKFIGDGIMALFGVEGSREDAARSALRAITLMAKALDDLNKSLAHEIEGGLALGVGLHLGPVIVGEMGHGRATQLTAIGDAVNTASRIESATKEFKAQLLVGESVARAAGVDLSRFPLREVALRGRDEAVPVRVVARLSDVAPEPARQT